jgi:hypothetical protein
MHLKKYITDNYHFFNIGFAGFPKKKGSHKAAFFIEVYRITLMEYSLPQNSLGAFAGRHPY